MSNKGNAPFPGGYNSTRTLSISSYSARFVFSNMAPVTRARAKAAPKSPKVKASKASAPQPKKKMPRPKDNATKKSGKKAASPVKSPAKPKVITAKVAKTPNNARPRKKGKGRSNARPASDNGEIIYAAPPLADSIGAHLQNDWRTAGVGRNPRRSPPGSFVLPPPRAPLPDLRRLGPGGRGPAPPGFSPLAGPGRRPGGRSRRTPEIPVFGPGSASDASPISPADAPRRRGIVRTPDFPIYGPGDGAGSRPHRSPRTPAFGAVGPARSAPRRRIAQESPTHRPERRAARPPPPWAGPPNPTGRRTRAPEPSSHTLSPGAPASPPSQSSGGSWRFRAADYGPGPANAIYNFPHLMNPITPRQFQRELQQLTDRLITDPAEVNRVRRERLERSARRERTEHEAREPGRRMSRRPSRAVGAARTAAEPGPRSAGNGVDAPAGEEHRQPDQAKRRGRRTVYGPARRPAPLTALYAAMEERMNRRAARALARQGTQALLDSTSGTGLGISGV